jgi:PleD family two-component response regulator
MVDNIDPTLSIRAPVAPSGGQSGHGGRQTQSEDRPPPRQPIVDVATVMSMPENVMPPAIQDAFLNLVEEVERLREEVERVRLRENHLLHEADHHPLLPVLNRRAFMSGLTRLLEASERAELPGSLAVFHIDGIEFLRAREGLVAGDSMLKGVAEAIQSELRQTDLLTYLDSSDFALALAVATPDGAQAKIDSILAGLSALAPSVGLGMVHFEARMTAEQVLAAADRARRFPSSLAAPRIPSDPRSLANEG